MESAMSTNQEIREHLDIIAKAIGDNGGSAELLNAVHACRPGHPLNLSAAQPFLNLQFMLAGREYRFDIPHVQRAWIGAMVANERDQPARKRGDKDVQLSTDDCGFW